MAQDKMDSAEDAQQSEKVTNTRFDPRLHANDNGNKDGKEKKVAHNATRSVGDGGFAQLRKGDGADIEEEDVAEQERDGDGHEQLIDGCRDRTQTGW
jgi:hypothetical protein